MSASGRSTPGQSALLVRCPEIDDQCRAWQSRWGARASSMPAHITLIVPFLPAHELTPAVHSACAHIAARTPAPEVCCDTVEEFPGGIWLTGDMPWWHHLAGEITNRWPEYPPFGGAYETIIPHVTLTAGLDEQARETAMFDAAAVLPLVIHPPALELWVHSHSGVWYPRASWSWRMWEKRRLMALLVR